MFTNDNDKRELTINIIASLIMIIINPIVIMLLWNWLLPMLFNFPIITFFEAMGLGILTNTLFGKIHLSSKKR